jgi:flagellar protein FliS
MDTDVMTLTPDPASTPVQAEPVVIPEHMVVLLIEGGQRLLVQIAEAIGCDDSRLRDHILRKVLTILKELHRRLNHEQGGELVDNLIRLYDWWRSEILDASEKGDVERLNRVRTQMGDIRQAWEHVLFQGEGMSESQVV